ncbi:hypothetical protein LHJ74_15080 [Streptomyces sp. N2-109]|uniref:Uncharacterized protein n=1 Tax=Streptomyces gossypii TaxID=2883101 RepID=A0ABT2JUR4_9ACTN|nr:hypothetical protein [Streptomyces gossypii]MCT2591214.1 hypothetical protein [Streptomyces gossypii]
MLANAGFDLGAYPAAETQARAYGQLNDLTEASRNLQNAENLRDQLLENDNLPGGMMAFPLAKQLFYASTTHLWLGTEPALTDAQRRAEEAIGMFEMAELAERRAGELALARLDLAMARLGRGDADGAAAEVHCVLPVAARRRTESVARRLSQFERRLAISPAA